MNYVVADDLTGAVDTGIQFQSRGVQTAVVVDRNCPIPDQSGEYRALSINADSRAMDGPSAYASTYNIIKKLQVGPEDLLYKKVDSALRGNCAEELDAVLDASGRKIALVAPSYPAVGRRIRDGVLAFPDGFKRDVELLFGKGKYPVHRIPVEELREDMEKVSRRIHSEDGRAVYLFDAETDEDLARIARLSRSIPTPVYCGSAGLAAGLLNGSGGTNSLPEKDRAREMKKASRILIVAGSRKKETADQLRLLRKKWDFSMVKLDAENYLTSEKKESVVERAARQLTESMKESSHGAMLVFNSLFDSQTSFGDESAEDKQHGVLLADAMGKIIYLARDSFDGLVLVGGDTALGVCRALGVSSIDLYEELDSGVIFGAFADGCKKGIPVVTKSGAFGSPELMIKVITRMKTEI